MSRKIIFLIFVILMASSANSATLYCSSNTPPCIISSLTDITQPNEAITVSGQPSNFVETSQTGLTFADPYVLKYIPTNIFYIFPNLFSFYLTNCSLTYLVTDSFVNCGNMISVMLTKTSVKMIPDGFAQQCSNITSLFMSGNSFETIDPNAFRGLTSLKDLDLSSNKLTCISPGLFQNTPNIRTIRISYNQITGIDKSTFTNLKYLEYADMSNNSMLSMPILDVTGTGYWGYMLNFGFSYNPINAISNNFVNIFSNRPSNATSITVYIIGINCVQDPSIVSIYTANYQNIGTSLQTCYNNWQTSMEVPATCGQITTTLAPSTLAPTSGTCPSDKICRYFLDQFNRYTCVIDGVDSVLTSIGGSHLVTFDDLNVRRVIFTNSFLSRVPPILFQKFPNLEYLTVSGCSMSTINTKTFTTCGNLRFLDASFNGIINVDGASFKNCTKIEVVDLSGNQISYIDGQLYANNPTLKTIYINRPPSMILI